MVPTFPELKHTLWSPTLRDWVVLILALIAFRGRAHSRFPSYSDRPRCCGASWGPRSWDACPRISRTGDVRSFLHLAMFGDGTPRAAFAAFRVWALSLESGFCGPGSGWPSPPPVPLMSLPPHACHLSFSFSFFSCLSGMLGVLVFWGGDLSLPP